MDNENEKLPPEEPTPEAEPSFDDKEFTELLDDIEELLREPIDGSDEESGGDESDEGEEKKDAPEIEEEILRMPPPYVPRYAPKKQAQRDPLGIASLVFAIASLTVGCCVNYIGLVLSGAAILLALMARASSDGKASGNARAGLIFGVIALVIYLAVTVVSVILLSPEVKAALVEFYREAGLLSFE